MTNRFGVDLHPDSVRWAAAEGVTETVIAAVLLLTCCATATRGIVWFGAA